MRLSFLGGSYKGRSTLIDSQECVNFYTEISSSPEAKEQISLIGTPGKRLILDLNYGVIRGQYVTASGRWFVVSGNKLFELFYDKRYVEIGKLKSNEGKVSFSENETQMILVDGIAGYLYYLSNFYNADGTILHAKGAFEQITTPEYIPGTVVINKDRFFIQNVPETGQFIYSRLGDGSHWTPDDTDPVLNTYTAEGSPDNLLTIGKVNNDIWLLGSKTIEIWSNTGNYESPFARVGSAFMDIGISAPNSFGVLNNTAIWLGGNNQGNGIVWTATGYIPKRVSTNALEYHIGQISDISEATAWVYQTEGHYFYVLNFGRGQKTICYDMSTDMWHERGLLNVKTGFNGRDLAETQVFFGGKNYVSDYRNSKIYELDLKYFYDDETNIKRIRTGGHIHDDRRRIFFHKFELDVQRGVGINPVGILTKD